ncbi:MAG: BLUF domain-containing protein [Alphaproteobacteria bacterium]|jgi:hypothetical protein
MVFRLVYSSKAVARIDDRELQRILSKARTNNPQHDLTGLLLFYEGEFLQVLEGPKDEVEALFKRISNDPRHVTVKRLDAREVHSRLFGDWSMAYVPISAEQTRKVLGTGRFFGHFSPTEAGDEHTERLTKFIVSMAEKMVKPRN